MTHFTSRQQALQRDADDALAPLRAQFALPDGTIYLDGNSLGVLPRATAARVQQVVAEEWGQGLIGSWNSAGWMELPGRIGDKIARLVGARPGELVAADSTSVNLFKVLSAALKLQREDHPGRSVIVSERSNFPTDLYIAETLAREHGCTLKLVTAPEQIPAALDETTALLMLTHVNYRTGRMHDMAALSAAAHTAGALAVWDLCHSAGAVEVNLHRDGADFAVGCGYKYLNGGPGAPAFAWVHPRHVDRFVQPLSGWIGHAAPFTFVPGYEPAAGISRYLCGTPPVLSLAALECGVDTLLSAEPFGGMAAIRAKSLALTRLFIDLVDARCAGHGLSVVSPREEALRGSQVCLGRDEGGYAIVQALIARGVVGDFRAGDPKDGLPDILRFGVTPLYTRFVDVWDAVEHLVQVLDSGEWRDERFHRRGAVT
ncbi:kynureninase [Aquincola sp. S2]|uniref:Kynureninase n=1 Tax=Pseudaquabacterium terrae TaxID=2732868 RepID=A0ABX2EGX9_9BURK|nr:kynureninase [Aquabacterium terrae]NRF67879.1 kynureninase [Aquabacterium terrae]